ncbi:carbohydrate-binding protein [Streptomyces sp. MS19]|uniref:carbohydrate-binding protein n=1 Tax=Streptomyces sp. MS19 TaxID=3385972 RepID=UPI0039A299B1
MSTSFRHSPPRRTRISARLCAIALTSVLAGAALSVPGTMGTAAAAGILLEAESAARSGGTTVANDHSGYTGTGFVGGYTDGNRGTASTTFTLTSPTTGNGNARIRYANGTGSPKTLSLYVNGTYTRHITFAPTANWDTWTTTDQTIPLRTGTNTLALTFTTNDTGNINLDNLVPTLPTGPGPDPDPPGTPAFQAEDAFFSGGPSTATSGTTTYLDGFTATGSRAVFAVGSATAASRDVTTRYRTTGATAATVTLTVNGTRTGQVSLPGTSGAWATRTVAAPLRTGLNTVTLRTEQGDNGAFQLDGITVADAQAAPDRGAILPYTSYEAEAGTLSAGAARLGVSREYLRPAAEASGRDAVVLDRTGEYVEVRLTQAANALTLRHSLPDNASGTGTDATLSLYAGGTQIRDLNLTSRHAWVYGAYPYTNNPGEGSAHRFFDESRVLLGTTYPAGTVLRFQKDSGDQASSYTLDLVEAENAPGAYAMPASGFVSAVDLGVTPGDGGDDTATLNSALEQARSSGRGLWLPAGTYRVSGEIILNGVTLRGAGPWHTLLQGSDGHGTFTGRGGTSTVQDLAVDGGSTVRDDSGQRAMFEGDFGSGSTFQNVWVEHSKVGIWTNAGTQGLLATGLRIRDTYADGVNLYSGTRGTEISHSSVRNTGDDALAMWSGGQATRDSSFRHNTVQLPMLANGAAVYGGHANRVEHNLIADTVTAAAGIAISSRFDPVAFSGTTSVQHNTLLRAGGYEPNWNSEFGALWIYADPGNTVGTGDITAPVVVRDIDIVDATYSGILVTWERTVGNLTVDDVTVTRPGTHGIEIHARGAGTFSGVRVSAAPAGGLSLTGGFTLTRGTGNSGW